MSGYGLFWFGPSFTSVIDGKTVSANCFSTKILRSHVSYIINVSVDRINVMCLNKIRNE